MSKYDLEGVDGNAFAIMGYVANALRREGLGGLKAEFYAKAQSGHYDNLVATAMEYVDKANEAAEAKENEE